MARQHLFDVGDLVQRRHTDLPAIRLVGSANNRRHHRVVAGESQFHSRLSHRVGVLDVGFRRQMPRRALQVVGNRPVILVSEAIFSQRRDHRPHAAQLSVTECVFGSRFGHQRSIRVLQSFGNADTTVTIFFHFGIDEGEKSGFVEHDLREQQHQWDQSRLVFGETHRCRDPSCVPAHHLEHENAGRRLGHRGDIERGFAHRYRDVLGDRSETRTTIGDRKVVVDGLGHMHRHDRIAEPRGDLRHLEASVGRIVAAVIEKIANVMGAKDLEQPFVLRAILVDAGELIAARAEGASRRVHQPCNRSR